MSALDPMPVCTACRQVYTDDESGLCADCQPGADEQPGSITHEQHKQISALLLDLGPVVDAAMISDFISGVIGSVAPPIVADLSGKQAGDVLEALENWRRPTRQPSSHRGRHLITCANWRCGGCAGPGARSTDYQPKHTPGAVRRPEQGAHRA